MGFRILMEKELSSGLRQGGPVCSPCSMFLLAELWGRAEGQRWAASGRTELAVT